MDTREFDEKNLAKHKERCDMIEQLALAEEESRKLGIRADKLEQRLESETRKAERRKRHIDLMGAALTERRNQLHERGERIAELEKQVSDLRAELDDTNRMLRESDQLSERERQILDMWPKFEDGEYVMVGGAVEVHHGGAITVEAIEFSRGKVCVRDAEDGDWNTSMPVARPLKRPVPKVLDADGVEIKVGDRVYDTGTGCLHIVRAINGNGTIEFKDFDNRGWLPHCYTHKQPAIDADGVEIKVGDTVWDDDGIEMTVTSLVGELPGHVTAHGDNPPVVHSFSPKRLTHTRPDSWKRLLEDACKGVCEYAGANPCGPIDDLDCEWCRFDELGCAISCEDQMALDILHRAKALAGMEVDE